MKCPVCMVEMHIPKDLSVWECPTCLARWFILKTFTPRPFIDKKMVKGE